MTDDEYLNREDDTPIDVQKDKDVKYWCEKLNVTPAWLRAAVKNVGPRVGDVRTWLRHNLRKARGE